VLRRNGHAGARGFRENQTVSRGRLEAFSDGVIAVLITIMVLDLKAPNGHNFSDLRSLAPKLSVYVLSFTFLAIYWNNHHHLMQVVDRISGGVLWANAHLLFWLSLTPAATAWLGSHSNDTAPVVTYGVVLFGAAIAFLILTRALLAVHPSDSRLAIALGRDWKGKLSAVAYVVGIIVAFVEPTLAIAIYVAVAVVWLVPDRRVERVTGNAVEGDRLAD
jgi:uncharacterized membrane protein